MSDLLKVEDVAAIVQLKVQTVRRLVQAGKIPHIKLGHRTLRFRREAIEKWLLKKEAWLGEN